MMSEQGGEGGTPKAYAVRKLSKGGCLKIHTRVKKSKKFADVICTTWPLTRVRVTLRAPNLALKLAHRTPLLRHCSFMTLNPLLFRQGGFNWIDPLTGSEGENCSKKMGP